MKLPNKLGIRLFKNPVFLYLHFRLDRVAPRPPTPKKGIIFQVLGDSASSAFGNSEMFEKQQKNYPD